MENHKNATFFYKNECLLTIYVLSLINIPYVMIDVSKRVYTKLAICRTK